MESKKSIDFMRLLSYNNTMVPRVNMKTGRVAQKARTRKDLIRAAWQLLSDGAQPTIEEVAEEAGISRATAYRYFPNRERLLIEAVLSRESRSPREILSQHTSEQPADRASRVQAYLFDLVTRNETLYRSLVRCSIDEWIRHKDRMVLRSDERLELLEEALRPYQNKKSAQDIENLIYALAALVGIESYIVLRDVCQLSKGKSKTVMSWAVNTLVTAVTEGNKWD